MSYKCPRCGSEVKRGAAGAAAIAGGVAGALFFSAFSSYVCPKCGKIPRHEFPPEVQSQMTRGSLGLIAIAIGVIVVVIILVSLIG